MVYAICYEVAQWAVDNNPKLRSNKWIRLLLEYCRPYWVEWRTKETMAEVDRQAEEIADGWEKDDRVQAANGLATRARELHPDAVVTPVPGAVVPSVMIETPPDPNASDNVKALGGEIRITYKL
jgi:hypothetical protein